MKGTLTIITVVLWAEVVRMLRMGDDYPLPQVLPFCGGRRPGIYDFAGCGVLFLFFFLLWTILSSPRENNSRERRFRHALWLVPLSLVLADYIRRNAKPALHWQSLLHQFNISDPERFSQSCVLITTCTAIWIAVYIWHTG